MLGLNVSNACATWACVMRLIGVQAVLGAGELQGTACASLCRPSAEG